MRWAACFRAATFAVTGDSDRGEGKTLAALRRCRCGDRRRDPQTPISVVGASIIGDTVDRGLWVCALVSGPVELLILAAINLPPLLPFDGGHIAVAVFERIQHASPGSARGKVAHRR